MISAIILAAGKSERMGKIKQLMILHGRSILERTITNYLGSGAVSEVIVVLGYKADEILKNISYQAIRVVINPDYEYGMSTSIIAGVKRVSDTAEAVMIAMGDQPLITGPTIKKLAEEFQKCDKGIVAPVYHSKRGQPVIFSKKYIDELLSLTGDTGAREVVKQHSSDVLEVPVETGTVLFDIDTDESYLEALKIIENSDRKEYPERYQIP